MLIVRLADILIWKAQTPRVKFANLPPETDRSNPALAGNSVISQTFTPNFISAFHQRNGKLLWRHASEEFGGSHVVYRNKRIFAIAQTRLVCLSSVDGSVIWEFVPDAADGEMFYASPYVGNGRLYIGDTNGIMYCLSAKTGRIIWKRCVSSRGDMINGTALVHQGVAVVGTNMRSATAFETGAGELLWKTRLDGNSTSHVAQLREDCVLSTWSSLYVLRIFDGAVRYRWKWKELRVQYFVVCPGELIVAYIKEEAEPRRLEQGDYTPPPAWLTAFRFGKMVWKVDAPSYGTGMRYLSDLKWICIPTFDGMHFMRPADGKEVLRIIPGRLRSKCSGYSIPASVDRTLYFQDMLGTVFAAQVPKIRKLQSHDGNPDLCIRPVPSPGPPHH